MRFAALAVWLLAGCTTLPPADMPYFAATASGDNLYPAVETRIYENDTQVVIEERHPYNNQRGRRTQTQVPGAFAFGIAALNDPNLPMISQDPAAVSPDDCCHAFVQRRYRFFDGTTLQGIPEAVWRQAAGIPPFVDSPIPAN